MSNLISVFGCKPNISWLFPVIIKRKLIVEEQFQFLEEKIENTLSNKYND